MRARKSLTYRFVIRTVAIYILVSGVYIFFSDEIVSRLFHNLDLVTTINIYKGWGFVLITGLLLYFLLDRETRKREQIEENLMKSKEQAEESDRLKSAFLANMSHEIRTPMNAIMGFSQLMEAEELSAVNRRKFARTIRQRTEDLLQIINDILDISRIESGSLQISEHPGLVIDLLEETREFFRSRNESIAGKNVTFHIKSSLTLEQNRIMADFQRLRQVLVNLVDNACKSTENGSIEIGCLLNDENYLQFYVRDTGIGIAAENLVAIFERFRQVDSGDMKTRKGGTGLGLSISKGIIELMKGRIWVESQPGKGSTFSFAIPFNPVSEEVLIPETLKPGIYNWHDRTILLVEDVAYNTEYLSSLLLATKVNLILAKDGVTALEKFYLHPEINLVLLDIRLPDITGFELAQTIHNKRKELGIIAQTAYASPGDRQKCLDAGCHAFITKPINPKKLFEAIDHFFNPTAYSPALK